VLGGFFRLRHSEHRAGAQQTLELSPTDAWNDTAPDEKMPLYRDVEQLAFAMLLDLGIPRPLILLDASLPDGQTMALGPAVALRREDERLTRTETPLHAPRYDGNEAPMLPKEIGRDFGVTLFDDRYVEGAPTAATVTRLLQLEDKILDRAQRQYGAEARLTLSYHNACFQDELDELMRARGHQVPLRGPRREQVPWWQFWRHFGRMK